MTEIETALKVLLRQRHLQGHRAFCREYDRAAKRIDPHLVGKHPGKAQFYKWLSGGLLGLPYADHCRVLEAMFPNWTADRLFAPYVGDMPFVPSPRDDQPAPHPTPAPPTTAGVADIVAAYNNRSDFLHHLPARTLFDDARQIKIAGLSLNILCQNYPDRSLLALLEAGTTVDALFLDPDGENITRREQEEGDPPGHLVALTRINLQAVTRLWDRLTPEARPNLRIRTYDEPVRFNIIVTDDHTCVVQPYLPDSRGLESPTLVLKRQPTPGGLFDTFAEVFDNMWDRAKDHQCA
ncbi:DUF5919 domain-containing protein [Actinokineospora sp. PR83]|uniref:DUF5919 domain-containing protein n=1 Tax=Actinokineospora sp. PR83 TaxID=2884908 RepID=UPI0027E17113|nr:DUF5919 domain-containing protein [Actinokineospora sp. PR83]MCG8916961.1 DUF5919 domain-containing protein [Actinokineospora sp. PR83]